MFQNIYVSALWLPLVNPAGSTFPNSRMKYSFVPKCRRGEWNKVHQGGLSRFLKIGMGRGVVFRSFPYNNWMNLKGPLSPYNYAQKSSKKRCGICSTKLTIKTSKRYQGFSTFPCFQCFCFFDAFVNFEQISHLVLEYILLVWTGKYPPSIFWFVHLFEFILLAFLL